MKIRFIKVKCLKCSESYTVNLGLKDEPLFCYRCGQPMEFPAIDMDAINEVNTLLEGLLKDYRIEAVERGLALSPVTKIKGKII